MTDFRVAQTGFSRVFLVDGGSRADNCPVYHSSMKAGAIAQSFGDTTKIEVPSPTEYGKFVEVGTIRGQTENATMTLTGRYASDLRSEMLRLAQSGCAVDIHINFGVCTNPSNVNIFSKKIILENALITNYSTEDLGALGSDEQAKIDESIDLSISTFYEVLTPTISTVATSLVAPVAVAPGGVTFCGNPTCGDCGESSTGCDHQYVAYDGDTSATMPFVVATDNNWQSSYKLILDNTSIAISDLVQGVACVGDYLVVVMATHIAYVALADVYEANAASVTWLEVAKPAGPATLGGISSAVNVAWVWGVGYIFRMENMVLEQVYNGTGDTITVGDISAYSDTFVIAGASDTTDGLVLNSSDGYTFNSSTVNTLATPILVVEAKNETEWFATITTIVYYTVDAGVTWVASTTPASSTFNDIDMSGNAVGYGVGVIGAVGTIFTTTNSGCSWTAMSVSAALLTASHIAACPNDPMGFVALGTITASNMILSGR